MLWVIGDWRGVVCAAFFIYFDGLAIYTWNVAKLCPRAS